MSEDLLISKVKQGNVEAFGGIMDEYMGRLRGFIALNAPVPHLIDEIAYEVFIFAFEHINDYQEGTSFIAWLRAIAWNLIRREIQRYSREQLNQEKYAEYALLQESGHTAPITEREEFEHLQECLEQVPGKSREILDMKYRDNSAAADIAAAFKKTEGWVRIVLFRLRKQLKECIESRLGGEPA